MKGITQILFTLLFMFISTALYAQQYQAQVTDSQWAFSGSKIACHMTHVIPRYGVGVFEQKSGEQVNFILKAESYVPPIRTAMLSSVAPLWMHDAPSLKLATVKAAKQTVVVDSKVSERMLQELSSGRFPEFSYKANQSNLVKVVVSSVNFLDAMAQFEACRLDLLPFSQKDVHQQLALFDNLSTTITCLLYTSPSPRD